MPARTKGTRGGIVWHCASPTQVVEAFSNAHFRDVVGRWRRMLDSAPMPLDMSLPLGMRREIAKAALGYGKSQKAPIATDIVRRRPDYDGMHKHDREKLERRIQRGFASRDEHAEVTWTEDLLRLVNWRLYGGPPHQRDDFHPIYEVEFNDRNRFFGRNAPFQFCRRLLGLPSMNHWRRADHGRRGSFDDETAERRAVTSALDRFLVATQTASKPCLVVHSSGYKRGLAALGRSLVEDDNEQPGLAALPRCLLYASPQAPPHKGVDLPFILQQMRAFYAGHTITDEPPVTDLDVRRSIEQIRKFMSRFPAVFIVDGVQDEGPDLADLRAAILDDPFRGLIQHLVHPDIGRADEPSSTEIFRMNRFIMLANGPCAWLAPFVEDALRLPPPGEIDAARYIESDDAYLHGPQLRAYFERQEDKDVAGQEPYLQCADLILALEGADHGLPPLGELAQAFVSSLERWRKDWLAPLTLLLLFSGGLRPQVLFRLLARWTSLGLTLEEPFEEAELARFRARFGPMVVTADDHTQPDAISNLAAKRRDDIGSPHETLTFISPATAEFLSDALLARLSPAQLSTLNVLLAEEAMDQHTQLTRHGERDDHGTIRANRRLLQAIYHGVNALSFAEEDRGDEFPLLMPITQADRFLRIYSMFYRLLLEAPPHWELSRVMSAERVKRDLLYLMLATGQPMRRRAGRVGTASVTSLPDWLMLELKASRSAAVVAFDLLRALGHALLQLNQFSAQAETCAALREALEVAPAHAAPAVQDDLAKLEIDRHVLQYRLDEALELSVRALEAAGIGRDILLRIRERLEHADPGERFPLDPLAQGYSSAVAARAIGFLQRWAEVLATRAEGHLRDLDDPLGPASQRDLGDAHGLFTFADTLRWTAFRNEPFARAFVPSGHATRTHIRVLLLLRRQAALSEARQAELLSSARRRIDTLTRTLARFPAERASMLIFESLIGRIEDPSEEGLIAALEVIIEADRQMIWAGDRPRHRMRLLFERAKLLCRLAAYNNALATKNPSEAKARYDLARRYVEWADFDIERLRDFAETSGAELWVRIAGRLSPPVIDPQERRPTPHDRQPRSNRRIGTLRKGAPTRESRRRSP